MLRYESFVSFCSLIGPLKTAIIFILENAYSKPLPICTTNITEPTDNVNFSKEFLISVIFNFH